MPPKSLPENMDGKTKLPMLVCKMVINMALPGSSGKSWKEVVREDCQARKLNKEDAMDRCKWRKMIKEAR